MPIDSDCAIGRREASGPSARPDGEEPANEAGTAREDDARL